MNAKEALIQDIDAILGEAFGKSADFDQITDAKVGDGSNLKLNANGGEDVIKNKGKKMSKMETLKKEFDEDHADEENAKEDKGESKADEQDEDEDEKEEDKMETEKAKKAKKSFEVSAEDFDVLMKAKAAIKAAQDKADAENSPLFKSMTALQGQVEEMSKKLEGLNKSPAREPKSLMGYQPIEKSENADGSEGNKGLKKSDYLKAAEELMKSGEIGVDHVIEIDASGTVADASVRELVKARAEASLKK